jgi:hypothetical protein
MALDQHDSFAPSGQDHATGLAALPIMAGLMASIFAPIATFRPGRFR